jgi:hypothetical protein
MEVEMLKWFATSWLKLINPGMHLLRVLCALSAVLLISLEPSLITAGSPETRDAAALEKTSGPKSEAGRTSQLFFLPPVASDSLGSPLLLIHEQNTSFVTSLTPRDYASNGAARAPPLSA